MASVTGLAAGPVDRELLLPIARGLSGVDAAIRLLDGRRIGMFRLQTGSGALGSLSEAGATAAARVVDAAAAGGFPVVGVLSAAGPQVHDGIAALHACGGLARAVTRASGVVPIVVIVEGALTGAPALLLGLADVVITTTAARCWITGPRAIARWTGLHVEEDVLGGPTSLHGRCGVAHLDAADEPDALELASRLLLHLPDHHLAAPAPIATDDPADRPTVDAARAIPASANASYDVRRVIADLVDEADLLELRPRWAPNLVTGLAAVGGTVVGVVANQPSQLAGTLDTAASQKGAGFVRWCDAFNIPLLTLVDTPGFLPGKDVEWQGMIRKGAQLAHAYAAATVPRVCVVLRKAYGGAYIVMDAKTMGSDLCLAWPGAEIAVMGAKGAVEILHRRRLASVADDGERAQIRADLEDDYSSRLLRPEPALERGFIDAVIEPADTRWVVARALTALSTKPVSMPERRHDNQPL